MEESGRERKGREWKGREWKGREWKGREASNPGPVVTRQGRLYQASHDTHVDVSSDEEPFVRRNKGRDVIATSQELREESVCTDTIIDDLEHDFTEIQHSMPGVLRVE